MKRLFLMIIFILIILSGVHLTGHHDVGGMKEAPARSVSISDYPQQDGGDDDRLFEYRSMWTEGYQIVNISEVRAVVKLARDNNFNCLSPLINGHYLGVFYESKYFPKYPEVKWDFDPLMELIKEAHKYNIQVMPWFHTLYCYPALREHPEWRDRTSSGANSSYWMDPSNPEVRDFLTKIIRELFSNYPLDGIKLDTIRYGGSSYGYSDIAVQKYHDEGWNDYDDFRRMQITEVVEILYNTIMDIRPYVWVGADIWHSYWSWYSYVYQDSRTWAQMGIIDFVTTMSYTTSRTYFQSNLVDNLNNFECPVVAGPYVYVPGNTAHGSVPSEQAGIDLLVNQTETAQRLGALGTCDFAYKFLRAWPSYARALRDGPFKEKALCPLKEQKHPVNKTFWDFENDHDRGGWRTTDMGNFYPIDGLWSVSNTRSPKFMSPLLNLTAEGTNVIEVRVLTESTRGNMTIYWSPIRTSFLEMRSLTVDLKQNRDWNIYSIHMDKDPRWSSVIRYIRIVFAFPEPANITIDCIQVTWMPYCIRSWSYLGPFFSGEKDDLLLREFIKGETTILPRIGDVTSGREWKGYHMERDKVDMSCATGSIENAVTYAHVYVRSSFEGPVELRFGNSDGVRIFFNGREVFYSDTPGRAVPDQNKTSLFMNRGINTLLLKLAFYQEENAFFVRFTAPGNGSLNGLEFFNELPPLGRPTITCPDEGWMRVSTLQVKWVPPANSSGLDHYEYSLDGSEQTEVFGENLTLSGLENGEHMLILRCVDNLGFPGEPLSRVIRVDGQSPIISRPFSEKRIVTTPSVTWNWDVVEEPLSGIKFYLITVESRAPGDFTPVSVIKDHPVNDTSFTLDDGIKDGMNYGLSVKAVSGSGLFCSTQMSENVLVDLSAPSIPVGLDISLVMQGSRTYRLVWSESIDGTTGGVNHYEVWWKVGEGEWTHYADVDETDTEIERPLYRNFEVRVRAVDVSGHRSFFSRILRSENLAPLPMIKASKEVREGAPVHFTTQDLIDIDGEIVEYKWYVDNRLISRNRDTDITLEGGHHQIWLWVVDDLGADGTASLSMEIPDGEVEPDASLTGWLTWTSTRDEKQEPIDIPHYNNRTVVRLDNSTDSTAPSARSIMSDILVIAVAISMLLLLLIILVKSTVTEFLTFRSLRYSEVKGEDPEDGGKEGPVNALISRSTVQRIIAERARMNRRTFASPIAREHLRSSGHTALSAGILRNSRVTNRIYAIPESELTPPAAHEVYEDWDDIEEWEEDT